MRRTDTRRLALHRLTLRVLTPNQLAHAAAGLSAPPAHPISHTACAPSNPGSPTRDPGSPRPDPGLPATH